MRVLEVEVEVAGLDGVDGDAPGLLVFHAGFEAVGLIAPPGSLSLELFDADRFALVVTLGARRIGVLVIPDVCGGRALGEEEEIGADAGVGIEDTIGQADNGVKVAIGEEGFFDAGLDTFAEEGVVWQHQTGAATGLEDLHEENEEEVGGFAGAELGGVVGLNAVFLHAAEGWVGADYVHAFFRAPVAQGAGESVVVADVGRHINAVQEKIGEAENVREMLFLDAGEALLNGAFVGFGLGLLAEVSDEGRDEAARAGRGVEEAFAQARIQPIYDELGDGSRGVELTGVACGLKVFEELFVDVAEHVAIIGGVKVDAVDLVDDLAHQRAVFHVVVGTVEGTLYERDDLAGAGEGLQIGQQVIIGKGKECITCDAFFIRGPVGPAEMFRERGFVIVLNEFHFHFTVVENLEEKHPAKLGKALGVAIDTGVFTHDVLDGFDEIGDVWHGLGSLLVKGGFEFTDRGEIASFAAEEFHDFHRRSMGGERVYFEDLERFDTLEAAVGVFLE